MLRLAVLVLLMLPAPAAAQWSPPAAVPGSDGGGQPRVTIDNDGVPFAAWLTRRGLAMSDGRRVAGAGWLTGPVSYYPRGHALAFTGRRQRRLYAIVDGRRTRIATGRRIASVGLATSAYYGELALAWFDDRGTRDEVFLTMRSGGRWLKRPLRIARGSVRSVAVAQTSGGTALVAWNTARGKVHTRLYQRTRLRPVDTIRAHEAYGARLHASFPAGRALVGWTAKFRSEGGDSRDTYVQVAVRPAGAERFRQAQLLHRSPDAPADTGTLRLGVDGSAVAWTQADGVYRALAQRNADFGPAERVAPAGAILQDVAGAMVVWRQDRRIFADGEALSRPGARDADAEAGPGAPTVVWAQDGRIMISRRG